MRRIARPAVDASDADTRALLLARARALAAQAVAVDARPKRAVATFTSGGQLLALPLEALRSCRALRGVTPVPLAPPHVLGIGRVQGSAITIYSLASLIGVRGWRRDPAVLLVVEVGARVVGLDCEEIPRAELVPADVLPGASQDAPEGVVEVLLPDLGPATFIADLGALLRARGSQRAG